MAFQKYNVPVAPPDTTVSHWMDPTLAMQFLRRARANSTPEAMARLDERPYAEQLAATRGLYRDVGNFFACINVPPQSCPAYVDVFRHWFGCATPVDPQAQPWKAINGIGPSFVNVGCIPEDALTPEYLRNDLARYNIRTVVTQMRWIENWQRLKRMTWREWEDPPIGSASDQRTYHSVSSILRLELDQLGNTIEQCVEERGEGYCGRFNPGTLYRGCAKDGATTEGCGDYNWKVMVWNDGPSAGNLFPLRWYFEFMADLIEQLLALRDPRAAAGPLGPASAAVIQSLQYVLIRNMQEARQYDILPADLAALAANLPLDIAASQQQVASQTSATIGTAFAIAAAAAAASGIGAVGGAVIGLIGAIATLVARVIPYAIAVEQDVFGRPRPTFLISSMTADRATGAPTHPLPSLSGLRVSPRFAAVFENRRRPIRIPGTTTIGPAVPHSSTSGDGPGLGTIAAVTAGLGLVWWLFGKPRR